MRAKNENLQIRLMALCSVGSTCGLVRGETNAIYIEYVLDHAKEKFNNKRVRSFPKKKLSGDKMSATIDICGYIQVLLRYLSIVSPNLPRFRPSPYVVLLL